MQRRRSLIQTLERSFEFATQSPTPSACEIVSKIVQTCRSMSTYQKKQANEIRIGNMIDVDGKLFQVLKATHSQGAGRQLGNVQLELRDVGTKSKKPLRLRPSDMINIVRLDERQYQFLYRDSGSLHCMDQETFEQIAIDEDVLGAQSKYLLEGGQLTVFFHDGDDAVSATLPSTIALKVSSAAPHIKNETAAPQYKPAVLETNAKVLVPPYVEAGDTVLVDTETGDFLKRA